MGEKITLLFGFKGSSTFSYRLPGDSPGPLIWEVLRLRRLPTIATTRALKLERLFLPPPHTVPSAVSDWLPSVRS